MALTHEAVIGHCQCVLPPGFWIERQIFVDEKPDRYDILHESPKLTGPECIAEAKAAGFTFG